MSNQSPSKSLISISLNQYWICSSLIQCLSLCVKSIGLFSQKVLLFCFRVYTYILHNTALVFNQLSETFFHVIVWLFLVSFSCTQLYHPTRRLTRQDNTPIKPLYFSQTQCTQSEYWFISMLYRGQFARAVHAM